MFFVPEMLVQQILAHLIGLLQRNMTCDLSHAVYAACKHCASQRTAGEAVYPTLHSFFCARKGFRCVLCRCCQQVGFRKA